MKLKLVAGALTAVALLSGCSAGSDEETNEATQGNIYSAQSADIVAPSESATQLAVPAELLSACYANRDWNFNRYQVVSSHTPISDLANYMGATWEKGVGGGWIMRAKQFDQLTGKTNDYAAQVAYGNDLSNVPATCGPKVVAVTRMALNGELLPPRQADQMLMTILFASQRQKAAAPEQSDAEQTASSENCFKRPYSYDEAQEYEATNGKPPEGEIEVCG